MADPVRLSKKKVFYFIGRPNWLAFLTVPDGCGTLLVRRISNHFLSFYDVKYDVNYFQIYVLCGL